MPNHKDEIEADVQRVSKLMRDLAERCYKTADREGYRNFKFESLGVVAVVTWEDEEGEKVYEDTAGGFESRRHYVQTGILADILIGRAASLFFPKGEE